MALASNRWRCEFIDAVRAAGVSCYGADLQVEARIDFDLPRCAEVLTLSAGATPLIGRYELHGLSTVPWAEATAYVGEFLDRLHYAFDTVGEDRDY